MSTLCRLQYCLLIKSTSCLGVFSWMKVLSHARTSGDLRASRSILVTFGLYLEVGRRVSIKTAHPSLMILHRKVSSEFDFPSRTVILEASRRVHLSPTRHTNPLSHLSHTAHISTNPHLTTHSPMPRKIQSEGCHASLSQRKPDRPTIDRYVHGRPFCIPEIVPHSFPPQKPRARRTLREGWPSPRFTNTLCFAVWDGTQGCWVLVVFAVTLVGSL